MIFIVATGFPCGQTPLQPRLEEIKKAVEDGASEIDIVINRTLALTGDWKGMYFRGVVNLWICDFLYTLYELMLVGCNLEQIV